MTYLRVPLLANRINVQDLLFILTQNDNFARLLYSCLTQFGFFFGSLLTITKWDIA